MSGVNASAAAIGRFERAPVVPPRRLGVARRHQRLEEVEDDRPAPELALRYSNGFVTVEITYDAFDAYVEANGDVPPVCAGKQTGDRQTEGARSSARVIYDRAARLREVTRSRDGHYLRLNGALSP